jgi:radical SAM superfamily enzyme
VLRRQARHALELKCQAVFLQAFELQERLAQQQEAKQKQRALCEQLAVQVEKWREKQLEVLNMRRKLEETARHAEFERIKEEHERFLKHQQQIKEKVGTRFQCS